MSNLRNFLKVTVSAARLEFLVIPFLLVGVGHAASSYNGKTSVIVSVIALVGLLFVHLAVNILNETSDYRSGIDENTDKTPFSGGSKALVNSDVNVKWVETVGMVFLLLGAVVGIYFIVFSSILIAPVLLLGVFIAYTYTDYLTKYTLGETGMALGLGVLPVIGVDIVQNDSIGVVSALVSLPIALVAFNLLLMNEFPDFEADLEGGRQNIIHRFGWRNATTVYILVACLTQVTIVLAYVLSSVEWYFLLTMISSIFLYRPVSWVLGDPMETPENAVIRDNLLWNITTTLIAFVTLMIPVMM